MTKNNTCPLISNLENSKPITVTDDEVKNSITSFSKLNTLVKNLFIKILIKLKKFVN